MKQPYIGNTKINKLYKGNELWCNWVNVDVPSTFETIIFCQSNNNIILSGSWYNSYYQCSTGTNSYYTTDSIAYIESNYVILPPGSYEFSIYYYISDTSSSLYSIIGDYEETKTIKSSSLKSEKFNRVFSFSITNTSSIKFKQKPISPSKSAYGRFYDWKLEKIN